MFTGRVEYTQSILLRGAFCLVDNRLWRPFLGLATDEGDGHKDIYRVAPAEESLVSTSGFMLGVLGGLLDFASATSIAINQGGAGMMNGYLLSPDAWAFVLVGLGILVVAVAVLSVTSTGFMHLKGFSLLMVLLGFLMALSAQSCPGAPSRERPQSTATG